MGRCGSGSGCFRLLSFDLQEKLMVEEIGVAKGRRGDVGAEEIADSLGCSIGTVMSRLFYARKKMQTMLRDVYEDL